MRAAQRLKASVAVYSSLDDIGKLIKARGGRVVKDTEAIHQQLENTKDFEYQRHFKDVLQLGTELTDLAGFFRIYNFKVLTRPDEFSNGQWMAKVMPSMSMLNVSFHPL